LIATDTVSTAEGVQSEREAVTSSESSTVEVPEEHVWSKINVGNANAVAGVELIPQNQEFSRLMD
jgi:hypothetical protein